MENRKNEEITRNICNAIKYCGKSKSQIAKEIGISCPTLSQYISGRINPSLSTFKKLCECIDASSDDILNINN